MIHAFVWPILIIALVVNNDAFKRIGITIAAIGSIAIIIAGAETWPLQLIAVAFYWIVAFLISLPIRWMIKKVRKSKESN